MQFRVGTGFDVHALVENRALILAGVRVPYERGLLGHSDADVALHALMDAGAQRCGCGAACFNGRLAGSCWQGRHRKTFS